MPCPALPADKSNHVGIRHCVCVAGSVNVSRSIRNMILDSIYESENLARGGWGTTSCPEPPTAVFVELLICASLLVALVMTPLTRKLVQKLWHQRQITGACAHVCG